LIRVINHFGEKGGFEALLDRLLYEDDSKEAKSNKDTSKKQLKAPDLDAVNLILETVFDIYPFAEPKFYAKFIVKVRTAIMDRITALSNDELKKLNKDNIGNILRNLEVLSQDVKDSAKVLETFTLDLSLRLIECPFLAQRILGMIKVTEMLDLIEAKENLTGEPQSSKSLFSLDKIASTVSSFFTINLDFEPDPVEQVRQAERDRKKNQRVSKYLTSKIFAAWLQKSQVVEKILSGGSHQELLRRCARLLRFLALKNSLTEDHLESLWDACTGQHEVVVRVVYEIICEIALVLPQQRLDSVYTRIRKIPLSNYSDFVVEFVASFSSAANMNVLNNKTNKSKAFKWYGVDIFWDLIQDKTGASRLLFSQAYQALVNELKKPQLSSQRQVFIKDCVDNVKKNVCVPQSLCLIQDLIKLYEDKDIDEKKDPKAKAKSLGVLKDMLIGLDKEYELLKIVFNSFVQYRDAALKSKSEEIKGNVEDVAIVAKFPHSKEIEDRLSFLEFVLSNTDLTLSKSMIDGLWDVLVARPVSPFDQLKWFNWLARTRDQSKKGYQALEEDTVNYIFADLLSNAQKLDPSSCSKEGFRCFEVFLRHINSVKKVIVNPFSRLHLEVAKFEIHGLSTLWRFVELNQNPEVVEAAKTLLITLHLRLEKKIDPKPIWKDFVNTVMERISSTVEAQKQKPDSQSSNSTLINNLIGVLKTFIDSVEKGLVADNSVFERKAIQDVDFKIHYDDGKKDDHTLYSRVLWSDETVGDVRGKVAVTVGVERKLVRLSYKDRIQYPQDDDNMLSVIGLQSKDSMAVDILVEPDPPVERSNLNELQLYPKKLLSNEVKYFDLLFQLLSLGGSLGQTVWNLLQNIPTNEVLFNNIQTLSIGSDGNWNTLIDPTSNLKLLYSLRIVQTIGVPHSKANEEERKQCSQWCHQFIEKGGVLHLIEVLKREYDSSSFEQILPLQSLATNLRLLNYFLLAAEPVDLQTTSRLVFKDFLSKQGSDFVNPVLQVLTFTTLSKLQKKEKLEEKASPYIEETCVITKEIFALLRLAVDLAPSLVSQIVGFADMKKILLSGLLTNGNEDLRKEISTGFSGLCKATIQKTAKISDSLVAQFLPILLDCIWDIQSTSTSCAQFFDLVAVLLELARGGTEESKESVPLDHSSTLLRLTDKIRNHPILEQRVTDFDPVLKGLLELVATLLKSVDVKFRLTLGSEVTNESGSERNGNLLYELYQRCLFELPTPENRDFVHPPKCKNALTRKAAFSALDSLVAGCAPLFFKLIEMLSLNHVKSHSNDENPNEWSFAPRSDERSSSGYVGIKNLGCICYSNSLMQQLFMMPKLRQNILSVEDTEINKSESFFFQFQSVLANLQESYRQYTDPTGFFKAFKEWDGAPTDISVQKDTNEFLNMLFDRIDTKVQGTPQERVLKDELGGIYSNQLICKGCPHSSERSEPFYCVTLEVKNKKSIIDSLNAFVEGEMLQGDNAYLCSTCNKKVDTLKRTVIKKLPPTIILHLKRFELDYETMRLNKLNDRCEFPTTLDLKPYTEEGIAAKEAVAQKAAAKSEEGKDDDKKEDEIPLTYSDDYYNYELRGVVVHTGSANGGHYYSFIKERPRPGESPESCKWYEFNDTIVRDFNPKNIPDECFGGEESITSYASSSIFGTEKTVEKYRNGYLLIYDRISEKRDWDAPSPTGSPEPSSPTEAPSKPSLLRKASRVRVSLPSYLFDSVWEGNVTAWRDQRVFDPVYFDFLWKLLGKYESKGPDQDSLVLNFACDFLFKTYCRARDKDNYFQWFTWLQALIEKSPNCNRSFLKLVTNPNSQILKDMLLENPAKGTRSGFSTLCINACKASMADEVKDQSGVKKLVDALLELLPQSQMHFAKFSEYFATMAGCADISESIVEYMISIGLIAKLIDFFLGEKSPLPEAGVFAANEYPRIPMESKSSKPDFAGLIALLTNLICCCETKSKTPPPTTSKSVPVVHKLRDVDIQLLSSSQFLHAVTAEASSKKRARVVVKLLSHWCWENMDFSDKVIAAALEGLEQNDYDNQRTYFRVFSGLFKIEDSLRAGRTEVLMTRLIGAMDFQKNYWKATDFCIEHVIRMAKHNELVFKWLFDNSRSFTWAMDWLAIYSIPPSSRSDNIQLFKVKKEYDGSYYAASYGLTTKEKLGCLEKIRSGLPLPDYYTMQNEDSDIGMSLT
jgi:ubiquitin carboxyl-terminal hydrolase 9/24